MRILVLADEPDPKLWDYLDRSILEGVELILSCGDLPAEYLSFLTCFCRAPILYVHGNHDEKYESCPPEGCTCVEDGVFVFRGVRIVGLGGSMRYRPGPFQYSEREMRRRARRLRGRIRRTHGFDILLTHAPAKGIGDTEHIAHRGFETFLRLMERYSPAYMVHGHFHKEYTSHFVRSQRYANTTVINANKRFVIELEPAKNRKAPLLLSKKYLIR